MLKPFKSFLNERVLSIGINDKHAPDREKHRQEIHDMIHKAYAHPDIGGYGGIKSGSKEESDAIHKDISNSMIKAHKRDGKITAVNLYRNQSGRKSIASATDGTDQGKKDWLKTKVEDHTQKRSWAEVSGKVLHLQKKMGVPVIDPNRAKELLNKETKPTGNGESYIRKIGGHDHEKTMMGHPKITKKEGEI